MAVVIVAIPAKMDRVWKASSEKIPHLTMMYLGDDVSAEDLQSIVQFVEHVANTTLESFGLSVDYRGELGDGKADVLFFEKQYYAKEVKEVIATFLSNNAIFKAFQSATQFPEWIPHLTLGWPDRPAKKLEDDYHLGYIHFDRIAVWTGDYDGPEFRLKERNDMVSDSYWSAEQPLEAFVASIEKVSALDALQFGRKGMRWGVRRTKAQLDADADPDAIKAVETQAKIAKAGSLNVVSSADLDQLVKRIQLEKKYISETLPSSSTTKKGQSFISKVIANEAGYFLTGKKGPLTKLVNTVSKKGNTNLQKALAAAKAAQSTTKSSRSTSYKTGSGPRTGPASRRTSRAQHVYNVTTLGRQGNFGDPNLAALTAPPRTKP